MATLRYTFRPNLFTAERSVVIDDSGITEQRNAQPDRRVPWQAIEEVHIEPAPSGDDGRSRFVLHLRPRSERPIDIDSVTVRGAADFEHKTDEFLAVVRAVHQALATRASEVRFRYGARSGIIIAWRIALFMLFATGIFATVAAIVIGEYDVLFGSLAFVGIGLSGLASLRGRKGPVTYNVEELVKEWDKGKA